MNKKTKVLATSIATIAMTASLAVGGTYALFTSEDKVNIAVSSGTVKVNANVDETSVVMTSIDQDVTASKTFANGGKAVWAEDTVKLDKITPGDKISFNIDITSESNVDVLYRTIVSCKEGIELFSGLKVTLDYANDQAAAQVFDGMTAYGAWTALAGADTTTAVDTVAVTVEFPYLTTSQNEYQGLSTAIEFSVEAVQGNADVSDTTAAAGETLVYNANDLKLVSLKAAKGHTFKGETVKLANDVDLGAAASTFAMRATPVKNWTPIANFEGTFDGQGHTISNLVSIEDNYAGLFGITNATIKNVTVENAYVNATSYAGVIAGQAYTGRVENCHVKGLIQVSANYMVGGITGQGYARINSCSVAGTSGSYVTGTFLEADLEGDNVGGIVGHIAENNSVTNCSVSGIAVSGTRKVGGVVGLSNGGGLIENAVVTNVTVESNADEEYLANNASKIFVGGILGEYNGNVTISGGSIANATVKGLVGKTGAIAGGSRTAGAVLTNNATEGENVSVTMEDSGVVYMTDENGLYLYNAAGYTGDGEYVIPEGVVTIGGSSFTYCNAKKVVMPSTLRIVKINAFKNSPVEEVVLNEGLVEIGERAFSQAGNLKKVTFPSTLTTVGPQSFRLTGMEEITLTAGLVNIGEGAFRDMPNLTTVTIENDAVLANYAFRSCKTLRDVYINGDVTFTGTSQVFTTSDNALGVINVYVKSEEMKERVKAANTSTGASLNIIVVASVNDNADFSDALNETGNVVLGTGEYTLPSASGKDVSIAGTKDTVVTINKPNYSGSDVVLSGVTVVGSGYSTGIQHVNTVTYNNVTIKGEMCLYGEKVVFNNCTFELNGQYVWTYAAKEVEFNNCTFNTTGKAILIYNEGAGASKVTVKGCTFNATAGAKAGAIANQNCAAIEIDNNAGMAHQLITEGNTYSNNFSGEWRIKNYVSGNAITVNGEEYTSIAIDGKTMTIDNNKNVTVNE